MPHSIHSRFCLPTSLICKQSFPLACVTFCIALLVPVAAQNQSKAGGSKSAFAPRSAAKAGSKSGVGTKLPYSTVQSAIVKNKASVQYNGGDVLARVEGEPVTRRELTQFWLNVDNQANRAVGALITDHWHRSNGSAASITVSDSEIYRTLYSDTQAKYPGYLSSLIKTRVVAIEARRKGILVTRSEAEAAAHDLLDEVRKQQNLKTSDAEILAMFHVPKSAFVEDAIYKLRGERLLKADIGRHNGHPVSANDWLTFRALFAACPSKGTSEEIAKLSADAKLRVQGWAEQVRAGKSLADVAAAVNEDESKQFGGLHGPSLRGTGTKSFEDALFALKSGQLSEPLRGKDGWYICSVEAHGSSIPKAARDKAWRQIVAQKQTPFIEELRRKARVTTRIPLPPEPVEPAAQQTAPDPNEVNSPPPPPVGQ